MHVSVYHRVTSCQPEAWLRWSDRLSSGTSWETSLDSGIAVCRSPNYILLRPIFLLSLSLLPRSCVLNTEMDNKEEAERTYGCHTHAGEKDGVCFVIWWAVTYELVSLLASDTDIRLRSISSGGEWSGDIVGAGNQHRFSSDTGCSLRW